MRRDTHFDKGTVVKLRSGGPKMTVTSHSLSGVWCQYFEKSGRLVELQFAAETLQKVYW